MISARWATLKYRRSSRLTPALESVPSRVTVLLDSGVTLRTLRQVPTAINFCRSLMEHAEPRGGYVSNGMLPRRVAGRGEQA